MPNFRQIHVSIWKDGWFLDLEPDEKLLFIYLFSNESTSLSGMYKLPSKVISFETGIDRDRMAEILDKFARAGKVYTEGDLIWVVNMMHYHQTKSSKVLIRISSDVESIPDCVLKRNYIAYHKRNIPYPYTIDTQPQLKEEEKEKEEEEECNSSTEPFRKLFDAFTESTGISELMINPARSVDEITNKWIPGNVTPQEVRDTVRELLDKNYNIVGPWSITNSLNSQKAKRKKREPELNIPYIGG